VCNNHNNSQIRMHAMNGTTAVRYQSVRVIIPDQRTSYFSSISGFMSYVSTARALPPCSALEGSESSSADKRARLQHWSDRVYDTSQALGFSDYPISYTRFTVVGK
jgi:hypothetical protein